MPFLCTIAYALMYLGSLLAFADPSWLTAAGLLWRERQQVGNDILDLLRRQDGSVTIALKDAM